MGVRNLEVKPVWSALLVHQLLTRIWCGREWSISVTLTRMLTFQIGVPEGGKVEKVLFMEGKSKAECQELVDSDPDTYKQKDGETPTW